MDYAVPPSILAQGAEEQAHYKIRFPPKVKFLFKPHPWKVLYGGRGAIKSWSFARAAVLQCYQYKTRVLCCREFQNSIKESVHQLLEEQIHLMGFSDWFSITDKSIKSYLGSEFIFYGLHNNQTKLKSLEAVDIAWVEEAEKVSNRSWEILIPTIRKEGSEIWVSFNPDDELDPTYVRLVTNKPPGAVVKKVSWRDNPWFPDKLKIEKDYLKRVDYDAYLHVWEGECRTQSDAQILRSKYFVEWFEISSAWHGPYQGTDWGFAKDPTTLIRCYISEDGRRLYISHEAYGIGVDTDKIPEMFDTVPDARKIVTRADCARPETISYLRNHGYPEMVSVEKWAGSVEDGIAFLRQFEKIIIHTRCEHTAQEAKLYHYKIDKLTQKVLPQVEDEHNHTIDAIRYALQPMIKSAGMGLLNFMNQQLKEKEKKPEADGKGTQIKSTTQQGIPPLLQAMQEMKK